jgi:hypothetical protein
MPRGNQILLPVEKIEFLTASPKDEFTGKNVVPLVFAMMNM